MVAVVARQPFALELTPSREAAPGPGEVAVHVRRAGICGSDLHILHGSNPFATYPRILGHEIAGSVVATGHGVATLRPGDAVVIDPVIACGRCYPCRIGRPNVCAQLQVIGVHVDGGFRDQLVVPEANALRVSPDLAPAVAALAEPLSIAANVTSRTGIGADDTVLIFGAGTVGLTVLQVAKMHGARAIVCDREPARLERARDFAADRVIDSSREDVADAVAPENDGLGPSLVIDGAGAPELLDLACRVVSPAGRIGLLGFSPEPSALVQKLVVGKELTIAGSRLNRRLLPTVIGWLETGRLRPEAMITQTFPAADALAAFALVEQHPEQTVKVQLAFDA
ncbi:MAG TPA: zinc-binding alcohol dehydrogenase family protein [Acetobacteraceae bacterium]|nr:zinc-binding alcohol dehydrogenase family protein [Acetobacteraceae bacterium]